VMIVFGPSWIRMTLRHERRQRLQNEIKVMQDSPGELEVRIGIRFNVKSYMMRYSRSALLFR